MLGGASSRKLRSIANLIGERGEMAKQPLPRFFVGGQWLMVSDQNQKQRPEPGLQMQLLFCYTVQPKLRKRTF